MNKPCLIAEFSPLSKTGCWHFASDRKDNLTISWLETKKGKLMADEEKSIDKILEVLSRLGDHIADAIDIARKAKEALPEGELDSDDKKRLIDGVYQLIKKIVLAIDKPPEP